MSRPRRFIDRQMPEKGVPVRKVQRRMSPTRGVSGLEGVKRRVRLEVGSMVARWVVVQFLRGSG